MIPGVDVLLRLFIAHVIGDFLLQPRRWVEDRKARHLRSPGLWWHGAVHGLLVLLAIGDLQGWFPALLVALAHVAIDVFKSYRNGADTKWFVLDQMLHAAVLVAAWWWVVRPEGMAAPGELLTDPRILLVLLAALLVMRPTAFFIAIFTKRWTAHLGDEADNLPNAGLWIGILERTLVLLFILVGHLEAVGFVLAAKSVFRFGDLRNSPDRMRTEYVLIGTLLSFGVTIGIGLLARVGLDAWA